MCTVKLKWVSQEKGRQVIVGLNWSMKVADHDFYLQGSRGTQGAKKVGIMVYRIAGNIGGTNIIRFHLMKLLTNLNFTIRIINNA